MMNNERVREIASRYDRSVVAVIVSVGMFVAFYIAVQGKMDMIVSSTPVVKEIQTVARLQEEKNKAFEKGIAENASRLDRFENKMDNFMTDIRSIILSNRGGLRK